MQFLKQIEKEELALLCAEKEARLIFIQNQSSEKYVFSGYTDGDNPRHYSLNACQSRLVWLYKSCLQLLSGHICIFEINLMQLTKLQAFIDVVFRVRFSCYTKLPFMQIFSIPVLDENISAQKVEYWYSSQITQLDAGHEAIIPFVRSTEAYQLIVFLIKENNSGEKSVRYLSQKYGLSNSYFRVLCKRVLGQAVKGEIRNWRLAHALIDMTKEQLSATDIAYRSGYSSLSHFSKEVKKILGHSTRTLKRQTSF